MAPRRRSPKSMRRSKKSRSSSQKKSKKASPQKRRRSFRAAADADTDKTKLFALLSLEEDKKSFLESFDDEQMITDVYNIITKVRTYVKTNKELTEELTVNRDVLKQNFEKEFEKQDEIYTKHLEQQKMLVNSLKTALSSIIVG